MCKLKDKTSYNPYDICNGFAEHFTVNRLKPSTQIPSPKKNIHDYINKIL